MAVPKDDDSTMVRRGKAAFSLTDMSKFVKDLQERPIGKLLEDLPGLLDLPEAKFALVSLALSKRMRGSAQDKVLIVEQLDALKRVGTALMRDRCAVVLKGDGSAS
jgi:hypothetical protein